MNITEDWTIDYDYTVNETVVVNDPTQGPQYLNKLWRCVTAHTSVSFTTDFGNGLWEELVLKGRQGLTGEPGTDGLDSTVPGPQGPAGANGADGVFAEIASTAEAVNGLDNTKGMTSLRNKEAFDAHITPFNLAIAQNISNIADNTNDISQNATDISNISIDSAQITANQLAIGELQDEDTDQNSRLTQLENSTNISTSIGKQKINNNQITPIDITGEDAVLEGGLGDSWELNPAGAKSATIRAEIFRADDAETRFSLAELEMHYINGAWYLERQSTTVMTGGADGVLFTVSTNGITKVGQVAYQSDNMIGGNYDTSSYIKFELKELSNF